MTSSLQNLSDGMLEAAMNELLPDLEEASSTIWGVRTGDYSGGWYVESIGPQSIELGNSSDHAAPLEFGWTLRNGGTMFSPGVLLPTIQDNAADFAEAIHQWLLNQ
jgi:hypothetical protein